MPIQPRAKLYRGRVADQIADDLRGQILSGALPDGSQLPSEQDLAADYDVSGPTIREAIRILTAMGLLSTRNGSRTTVTARSDALLAMSIASVIQFEKMRVSEVLGLLGALNAYAVELAVRHASDEETGLLLAAAERSASGPAALKDYFATLATLSHNPLLAALSRSITEIQIGLAVELSGNSAGEWGQVAGALAKTRIDIAEAIAARDSTRAVQLVHDYHAEAVRRIQSLPRAMEMRDSDPGLTALLSSWLGANVNLSNR